MYTRISAALIVLALTAASAIGQTPLGTSFTYQGQLKNSGSSASGLHDLRFKLYDALTLGAPVGAVVCIDDVNVIAGLFTVSLDFGAQFAGQERFLEIEVRADTGLNCSNPGGFSVLTPRQALTAVPHALLAQNATNATTAINTAQLNGQTAAFYQNVTNQNAGTLDNLRLPLPLTLSGTSATHIIRGQNAAGTDGAIGVFGATTAVTGQVYGGRFECASPSGRGVFGYTGAPTGNTYGVQGRSDSTTGYGVFGDATALTGLNYGGWFRSASTSGDGLVGQATAGTGLTFGVVGENLSTGGRGVFGSATAATGSTRGVWGQSDSTSGRGVYGNATAPNGTTDGVYGLSASTSGEGVVGEVSATTGETNGVRGLTVSSSENAAGVYGRAAATTGVTYGGRFDSDSTSGRAVSGYVGAASGPTYGVLGQSESSAGSGVAGFANATTGVTHGVRGQTNSPDGRGVYGLATNPAGFNNYGVLGQASGNQNYAVFANGASGASGVKNFRIDHPDDPENKYLLHYSIESPEAINFYRGAVMLDVEGQAVVELPHYFAKVNKSPSYTLTAVGAPMPALHIAAKVSEADLIAGAEAEPGEAAPNCSFRIAGGAPGGEVSWRVEAARNDLWMRKHGARVEVEKQGLEKGTYQHPELYGQPPEKGTNY